MSNQLSPAQALPVDVLRSIMKWVIVEHRSALHENSYELSHLKELLSSSPTWRQVALEFLWRHLKLSIDIMVNKVNLSRPEWVNNNMLPHNVTNFVRKIHVTVPMSGIVSGVAHKLLVDYIGDTKCFPLAKMLIVQIVYYRDRRRGLRGTPIVNALEFAKLLKSMVPAATPVQIICTDFDRGTYYESESESDSDSDSDDDSIQAIADNEKLSKDSEEGVLRALMDVIYVGTKRADLIMYGVEVKGLSNIDHIPPLTRLTLYDTELTKVYTSLVHKSSSTLQYLDIKVSKAYKLIFDANGEVVLYPNLQHLRLDVCISSGTYTMETSTDTICFPVLRSLRLNRPYPFHDNILFRGNSTTLEYLSLFLDNNAIVMLNQWRVFDNRNKVLQHVAVHGPFGVRDVSIVPDIDMNRLLSNLINGVKSLTLSNFKQLMACITTARYGHGFQSINVLDIRSGCISFFDVLSILKTLPALIKIRCGISELGTMLENIATEELPDHMATAYCDVGKNLQVWTMTSYNGRDDISEISNYILLLALVCPKLWKVELVYRRFRGTCAKISDALNSLPYSKYAHRLSKIIDAVRE